MRRETFQVHTYEVDAFDALAAPVLAGFMQEVAGLDAAEMGCGLDVLMSRGLGWVLARQRIEMSAPIPLGERLIVATWPSGIDRLFAQREFQVSVGEKVVARASTDWLVMDLERRRPVRPSRVLAPEFHPPQERLLPSAAELPAVDGGDSVRSFEIRYSDIDRNLHVTNTTYLAWAMESVPAETWQGYRLAAADIHFLAECTHGGRVESRICALPDGEFAHSILREDDHKERARASTRWVLRTSARR